MSNEFKIAVVGASGAVGEVMLSILAEHGYPAKNVVALASERLSSRRPKATESTSC